MPGSTSVIYLFPETSTAILVLQNSVAATDSADLVCQLLEQTIFDFAVKNDYVALARQFALVGLNHREKLKAELETNRAQTFPRLYWNILEFSSELCD